MLVLVEGLYIIPVTEEGTMELHRELCRIVDEINDSLPEYEVRLVHVDTADYIEFLRKEDVEGGVELEQGC